MKRMLPCFLLLTIGLTLNVFSDAATPAAMASARERYEDEVRAAQRRYLRDLRNLKSTYTQQGDLEKAKVVEREMNRVRRSAGLSTSIPDEAIEWSDHFYWFPKQTLNFRDALDFARERGGYLVVIESDEENDFVTSHLKEMYTWIGLHRRKFRDSGDWIDAQGKAPSFLKWDVGQGHGRNQPYGGIKDNGLWHNFFGDELQRFVVEWE